MNKTKDFINNLDTIKANEELDKEFIFLRELECLTRTDFEETLRDNPSKTIESFQRIYKLFLLYEGDFYRVFNYISQPDHIDNYINPCTPYLAMSHFVELLKNKEEIRLISSIENNKDKFLEELNKMDGYNLLQNFIGDFNDIYATHLCIVYHFNEDSNEEYKTQ